MNLGNEGGNGLVGGLVNLFFKFDGMLNHVGESISFRPTRNNKDKLIFTTGMAVAGWVLIKYIRKQRRTRRELQADLAEALALVEELQTQLERKSDDDEDSAPRGNKEEVRVFVEGAFDMMHYGHMNAFRQARSLGTHLVAGINSDQSIMECKGSLPLMNDRERQACVSGCKWVDEVIPETPYVMTDEYLKWVIREYRIDYVVHGDDPCLVNGQDVYANVKKIGKFKSIPRTEGVSTTDLVGRMLLQISAANPDTARTTSSNDSEEAGSSGGGEEKDGELPEKGQGRTRSHSGSLVSQARNSQDPVGSSTGNNSHLRYVRQSSFLTTGRMIRLFSAGHRAPPPGARIVYVDGSFDMFHAGHIELLKEARALGNYLIVGLYNDAVVNRTAGDKNLPIMNLNERVLSVLGCRHVDDVLIDAPLVITRQLLLSLKVSIVAHGISPDDDETAESEFAKKKRYAVPLAEGIVHQIPKSLDKQMSVEEILRRVKENEDRLQRKFKNKAAKEAEYYKQRYSG